MDREKHHRGIQSFVRREGRLTRGQQRALDELWPVYGISAGKRADLRQLFAQDAPVTLEIGFGNGDALAQMAQQQPARNFIGIEVHRPGVGHLLRLLHERGIGNVRLYNEDAVRVLKDCIPDDSLERVLLFFPDPWHKKRHHKRRIVQADFLALLARKLEPGGVLHMATDWQDYALHMLELLESSPDFVNCAGQGSFSPAPAYRPVTRFEQRGRRLGHGVWDLLFRRR